MMARRCKEAARPWRSPSSSDTAIDTRRSLRLGRVALSVLNDGQLVQAGGAAPAVVQLLVQGD